MLKTAPKVFFSLGAGSVQIRVEKALKTASLAIFPVFFERSAYNLAN